MVAFSDLISTKKLDDWKKSIVTNAALVGLSTENWAEGGYTRTLVALFAQLYKTAGDVVKVIASGAFLDTAEKSWLEFLAKQVFNVDKIQATFATASQAETLTNTGGGLFVLAPGDVTVKNPTTKKTYHNTNAGTLTPGPGTTLKLDLVADEAGSLSSSGVGTITELVTTMLGVTCTNTIALVGLDAELDPALRQRCRDSIAALAIGGIKKAYEFIAKSSKRTDGTSVGITRVFVVPPTGNGSLTIYVAGASGAVTGPDVAFVQADFDAKVNPYGLNGTAVSASNRSISALCTIWIPASLGLSEADARQKIFDAVKAYVESLPIGGVVIAPATGKVYWRALLGIIEGSIAGTLKAQLTSEVDVDVAANEVPVWGGNLVDTTVVQVTS